MNSGFKTVAIVARRQDRTIADTVVLVSQVLSHLGAELVFEDQTAASLRSELGEGIRTVTRSELADCSDLIVVVGGDGSLLGVSRDIRPRSVPIVGVNRGGLGFLAAVSPELLEQEFNKIWQGEYSLEDHFFVNANVVRDGEILSESSALNDVVVQPSNLTRMIEFELWVNDEFVYDQRSDGVIVASPTGSTAYSLSAGGPIMHPSLDAIVIVPMFPHTLTSRPLVVRGDSTIRIEAKQNVQVSCDSQVVVPLTKGDQLILKKSAQPLKLLYPEGHSFFESCRSKLDWASRLGGRDSS
ncbi:MAG: NAD+ kinase [Limisphaerales bacterium]|jgi:NAD+ kinase